MSNNITLQYSLFYLFSRTFNQNMEDCLKSGNILFQGVDRVLQISATGLKLCPTNLSSASTPRKDKKHLEGKAFFFLLMINLS